MIALRDNWLTAFAAATLLVAVTLVAGHFALGDDPSLAAGREYGESQALMYNQINAGYPTDEQLEQWCHEGAALSANIQVWYRGGVIQVGELDTPSFTEGCIEAYGAATR
ncbi:succinate dehydrogenase [Rhodococcus sp. ABRD24]|uniref:succinate dehydrogenase n=1 Tax=Rhodococcus sp. ABRD24 TaxID=2507582 RepID=UPI00103ED76D|nr:succinate dehydrogenase [Rhodococcus sp. ABRD24]QBJ95694.1 succinate dehydrogenase [Rhodococcus sp. ABRD24]